MRTTLTILALLVSLFVPAAATAAPACVSLKGDVSCDFAVSGTGSADGAFLAVSGTGEASTYMDRCLESICPSVAVSAGDDVHAGCHASSVCVAIAGRGHASNEGLGVSVGGCDAFASLCKPLVEPAPADSVCLGDGPLGVCIADLEDPIGIQPPVYCLHGSPCPDPDV